MSFSIRVVKDQDLNTSVVHKSERIPIVNTSSETPLKGSIALDSITNSMYFADGTKWTQLQNFPQGDSISFLAILIQTSTTLPIGTMDMTANLLGKQVTLSWGGSNVVLVGASTIGVSPVLPAPFHPLYSSSDNLLPAIFSFSGGFQSGFAILSSATPGGIGFASLAGAFPGGPVTIPPGSVSWLVA